MSPLSRAALTLGALLAAAPAVALERPAPLPEPLQLRGVVLPAAERGVLSNGLAVLVVTDTRAPLVEVRLVSRVGPQVDPPGKEGLASAVFALSTAGTPERDADALSRDARRLGVALAGSTAGPGGEISASGLARNLPEMVALWASTVRAPTYPPHELDTWRAEQRADLARRDKDPNRIATSLWWQQVYGEGYLGRSRTRASLDAITVDDLRGLHARHLGPENSLVMVGGDVTLQEVLPLLEAHLGDWRPEGIAPVVVDARPLSVDAPVLYLVDHPGASQTHIRSGTTVPPVTAADHFPLIVANHAFGGAFTSRVNLNLREDKGYTYGARCWLSHHHGDGQLGCSTSVQTAVTGPALQELHGELDALLGDRPLTDAEVHRARDAVARRWPAQLETVGARLDHERDIWQYDLPQAWLTDYVGQVARVTTTQANEAVRASVLPQHTFWLVVGDAAVIRSDLESLGLPIVLLDIHGQVASPAAD